MERLRTTDRKITGIDTRILEFQPDKFLVETPIQGLLICKRPYFPDDRGGVQETFRIRHIESITGFENKILQGTHSDMKSGTRKGFHCERQSKILTINGGEILFVELDIRKNSPTFGKYIEINVDTNSNSNPSKEKVTIYIPKGVGNSMQVIQPRRFLDEADIDYQITAEYDSQEANRVIRMDDLTLDIDWPDGDVVVSDRDKKGYLFDEFIDKYGDDY